MSAASHEAAWHLGELREDGATVIVDAPLRALDFARRLLPSKPVVARAFDRGQLTRKGERICRDDLLATGDVVSLTFWRGTANLAGAGVRASEVPGDPMSAGMASQDGDVPVVYRDPLLMVVDKPRGLLVHADGTMSDTLTDRVRSLLEREGRPAVPQAVQRLDVETTGLVLFSLTEEFQPALDAQVAGHDMHKRYLVVVRGAGVAPRTGWRTIDAPLGRDRHDARRMRVSRGGKASVTRVRELAACDGEALLLVELGTGRRHQIRVHLAHVGHPIVGDALYGGSTSDAGLMLHAWEERLTHPLTGEVVMLRTAWPRRFERWRTLARP